MDRYLITIHLGGLMSIIICLAWYYKKPHLTRRIIDITIGTIIYIKYRFNIHLNNIKYILKVYIRYIRYRFYIDKKYAKKRWHDHKKI